MIAGEQPQLKILIAEDNTVNQMVMAPVAHRPVRQPYRLRSKDEIFQERCAGPAVLVDRKPAPFRAPRFKRCAMSFPTIEPIRRPATKTIACSDKTIIIVGHRRARQQQLTILGACNHTACGSSHISHLRGSYRKVSRRHCPGCGQFNAIEYSFAPCRAIK